MTKPYLNNNPFFRKGTGVGFTEVGTAVSPFMLDRRDDRHSPKRLVFPSALKASDYIYNGRFSRRYTIASGETLNVTMAATAVRAGQFITLALVYRQNFAPVSVGTSARIQLTGDLGAGGSLTANLTNPTSFAYLSGSPFIYVWSGAAAVIPLVDPAEAVPFPWQKVGFTMECPSDMTSFVPRLRVDGPGAGVGVFDMGEFSVQGQLAENDQT